MPKKRNKTTAGTCSRYRTARIKRTMVGGWESSITETTGSFESPYVSASPLWFIHYDPLKKTDSQAVFEVCKAVINVISHKIDMHEKNRESLARFMSKIEMEET